MFIFFLDFSYSNDQRTQIFKAFKSFIINCACDYCVNVRNRLYVLYLKLLGVEHTGRFNEPFTNVKQCPHSEKISDVIDIYDFIKLGHSRIYLVCVSK